MPSTIRPTRAPAAALRRPWDVVLADGADDCEPKNGTEDLRGRLERLAMDPDHSIETVLGEVREVHAALAERATNTAALAGEIARLATTLDRAVAALAARLDPVTPPPCRIVRTARRDADGVWTIEELPEEGG
jgi:hypothetical protein